MMDSLDYTLFPNFHPWGAFNRIVYRFRPNGDDHRTLDHGGASSSRPSRASGRRRRRSTGSAPTSRGPTLPSSGVLAKVFEQDTFNMAKRAARPGEHPQARDHAGQLPGEQGPLAPPAARRVDATTERGEPGKGSVIDVRASSIRSARRSTSRTARATSLVTTKDGRVGRYRRDGSWLDGAALRRRSPALWLGRRPQGPAPPAERAQGQLSCPVEMHSRQRRTMTVRPFRFGAKAVKATSAKEWTDLARQAEDLGYASFHDGRPLRQPAGAGPGADGRGGATRDPGRPPRGGRGLPQPGAVRQGVRHHRPAERGPVHAGHRRRLVGQGLRRRRHPPGRCRAPASSGSARPSRS